jgi:hypothetical protein
MNTTTPAVPVVAPSQGPAIIAVSSAFLLINVFSIGTRCYTKLRISKDFGYNDVGMITVLVRNHEYPRTPFVIADNPSLLMLLCWLFLSSVFRMELVVTQTRLLFKALATA